MNIQTSPRPCAAGTTYTVIASAGTAPYTYTLQPAPPNPPGLELTVVAGVAYVSVPAGAPRGAILYVEVADSASPPSLGTSTNAVS